MTRVPAGGLCWKLIRPTWLAQHHIQFPQLIPSIWRSGSAAKPGPIRRHARSRREAMCCYVLFAVDSRLESHRRIRCVKIDPHSFVPSSRSKAPPENTLNHTDRIRDYDPDQGPVPGGLCTPAIIFLRLRARLGQVHLRLADQAGHPRDRLYDASTGGQLNGLGRSAGVAKRQPRLKLQTLLPGFVRETVGKPA